MRCYSLRIRPQNASKRRRNLEEIDGSYLCCETSNVFCWHVLPLNLLNCVNSNPVTNVTQAKNKHHQFKKKNPRKQNPCHSLFSGGIICSSHRGSFAVRDHLRSNLGIICGLGIICRRGSFAALYSSVNYCRIRPSMRMVEKVLVTKSPIPAKRS